MFSVYSYSLNNCRIFTIKSQYDTLNYKKFNEVNLMTKKLSSKIQLELAINAQSLWRILTESEYTQAYMFNCSVESEWVKGSVITWQGNYQDYQAFQKGEVLAIKPFELIKYSTFDPNLGLQDIADNYIHVTYLLEENSDRTKLTISNDTFDGNKERMKHVMQGWKIVVKQMEEVVAGVLK